MVDDDKYARDSRGQPVAGKNRDPSQVMREFRVFRPDDERYSTLRAVLWLVIATILVGLLVTGLVNLTGGSRLGDWTAPDRVALEAGPGELITFVAGRFEISGADRVKLMGAAADSVPQGLEVVDIQVGVDEGKGPLDQVLGPVDPIEWTLRGVEGLILSPGPNEDLYLTMTLRSFGPGTYELPDLVVRYESDRLTKGALFRLDGQFSVR